MLVAELDASVPRDGAVALLKQYGGGPDESSITANRAGALRVGIEFLRAAVTAADEADAGRSPEAAIDLDYLLDAESTVGFDWLELRDHLDEATYVTSPHERLVGIACGAVVLFLIAATLVGIGTMISWLF